MLLDIFSDTICPWCFVGKRRLERALIQRPQNHLRIRWRAFQLNPGIPAGGMDRQAYLDAKFGGPERAKSIYDAVLAAGGGEGIAFAFDHIKRTPNTLMSHRLVRYASVIDQQDQALEGIFRGYFLEGRDIGSAGELTDIGAEAGLDRKDVASYLAGDADADSILAEDSLARRAGINGVPCFIFNTRFALSGAQEPEAFHQLFDLAREDDAARLEAPPA
ncbi:MAG: DsbA family oxidoreductase [Dongiaceae bacterium]